MTDIVFSCQCGKIYHFSARFAGRTTRCLHCKREYIVPAVSEHVECFEAGPRDSSSALSSEHFDDSSSLPQAYSDPPAGGATLGKYEIHEEIGHGGMGRVYSAWDVDLCREVTVKRIRHRYSDNEKIKKRFVQEARITGKLMHPGIVPVYSLDFDVAGQPYYAMRLLEGRTLEQLIKQFYDQRSITTVDLRKLLRHFVDVCDTIAYAHAHFVIHRDLKPSNIMLGGYGETFVLDWGLSKIVHQQNKEVEEDIVLEMHGNDEDMPGMTMDGTRVGTHGYQSPEYLHDGVSRPSDDIFALGVTLYHMLCNKSPYDIPKGQRGVFEMMMTPPKPPHRVNTQIDPQLSAICLCALACDTTQRYPSADRVAADVQNWLDGEPVSVYRMKRHEKIRLFFRSRKAILPSVLIGMGCVFAVGIVLGRWLFH